MAQWLNKSRKRKSLALLYMKNSHSNHILNTFVQKPGNHMVALQWSPCYVQQNMSQSISPS